MTDRSKYLGSSDAKDVASIEPYGCRRSMVLRKAGVPVDDAEKQRERFDTDEGPVYRGKILEPVIRAEVARKSRTTIHEWTSPGAASCLEPRHDLPAWFGATPDGVFPPLNEDQAVQIASMVKGASLEQRVALAARLLRSGPGLLEIKSVDRSILWSVRKSGPRLDHVFQVEHQLIATGAQWAFAAYLEPSGWRYAFFLIWHDAALEKESYLPAAYEAWAQVQRAQSGIDLGASPDEWEAFLPARLKPGSPQCRTCSHRRTCWGQEFARVMEIPTEGDAAQMDGVPEWEAAAADLIAARSMLAEVEEIKEDAEARIKALIGDGHAAEGAGLKVYYKPTTQRRLDTAALKKALPEVAEKYMKDTPIRALRVYPI